VRHDRNRALFSDDKVEKNEMKDYFRTNINAEEWTIVRLFYLAAV
jgi:hypothetical protein